MPCLSYYLLCLLLNKIGEQEGGTGSARRQGGGGGRREKKEGEVAQIMYTHVSKCKNNKIRKHIKQKELYLLSMSSHTPHCAVCAQELNKYLM
jgi:hypothetical protein